MFGVDANDVREVFERLDADGITSAPQQLAASVQEAQGFTLFQKLKAVCGQQQQTASLNSRSKGASTGTGLQPSAKISGPPMNLQQLRKVLEDELATAANQLDDSPTSFDGFFTGQAGQAAAQESEVLNFDDLSSGSGSFGAATVDYMNFQAGTEGGASSGSEADGHPCSWHERVEAAVTGLASPDTQAASLQLLCCAAVHPDDLCCTPVWPPLCAQLPSCLTSQDPATRQAAEKLVLQLLEGLLDGSGAPVQLAQLLQGLLPAVSARPLLLPLPSSSLMLPVTTAHTQDPQPTPQQHCPTRPTPHTSPPPPMPGPHPPLLHPLLRALTLLARDWHYLPPGLQPKAAAAITTLVSQPPILQLHRPACPTPTPAPQPAQPSLVLPADQGGGERCSVGFSTGGQLGGVWLAGADSGSGRLGASAEEATEQVVVVAEVGWVEALWLLDPEMRWWRRMWASARVSIALGPHMRMGSFLERLRASTSRQWEAPSSPEARLSAAAAAALCAPVVCSAAGRDALEACPVQAGGALPAGWTEGQQRVVEVVEQVVEVMLACGAAAEEALRRAAYMLAEALQDTAEACPHLLSTTACSLLAQPLVAPLAPASAGGPARQPGPANTSALLEADSVAVQGQLVVFCAKVLEELARSREGAERLLALQAAWQDHEAPAGGTAGQV